MKKYIFLSLIMTFVLFACKNSNSHEPKNGGNGGEENPNLNGEAVNIIEADHYSKNSEGTTHYVSMRFVTDNVGYITKEDSSVYVSGSGTIIDILLVAQSVDENKVPIAGTYNVGSEDAPYIALNNERYFGIVKVLPAIYNVSDGDVSSAISYNSGTIQVVKRSQIYKIYITLNCSDGVTRKYEYDGQITVINHSQTGNVDAITINQGETITMESGQSLRLSISFSPYGQTDNVIFESSNPTIVNIPKTSNTTGVIYACKEGTCDVTARCVHNYCSATITVNVISQSSVQYEFGDLYIMQATDEMPEERYCIYRLRQYRGDDIMDGKDASLTKVIDNTKNFPDEGTWLYRYTNNDGREYGIFADSILSIRAWLCSSNVSLYDDGDISSGSFAPVMEYKMNFVFDNRYYYCLGNFSIESDATATDTIRKPGVAARPMPGTIQASRFNQAGYLNYYTDMFNGSDVNKIDYNIFGNGDARLIALIPYDDASVSGFFGCVNSGNMSVESNKTSAPFIAGYYDINATVYENPMAHCLATESTIDPSTGQVSEKFVVPYQMAESRTINYTGGENPNSSKKQMIAIPKHQFEKQIKINNTISAVLRMYIYSQSKRWY